MVDQKCYIATIVTLCVVGIGLLAGLLYLQFGSKKPDICVSKNCSLTEFGSKKPITDNSFCVTKNCLLTAATLVSNMDTTINPCEDFYQFSCGNFIKTHPVIPGKVSVNINDQFYGDFELQLSKLVEEWNSMGEPNVVFRLQEAYHVCINTTYQRPKELAAFEDFTRNILDWPLMIGEKWLPRYKTHEQYLALFEEMGLPNPLVDIEIAFDESIPSKYEAQLTPPEMKSGWFKSPQFQEEEKDKEKIFRHTRDLLVKLLHLLGNNDDQWIELQMKHTLSLASSIMINEADKNEIRNGDESEEIKLEAGSEEPQNISDEANEDYNEHVTTFGKLFNITARTINWADVINKRIGKTIFTSDSVVYLPNPAYFKRLGKTLQNYSLRTFLNFFGLEILFHGVVMHASPDVDSLLKEYVSTTEKYNDDALISKAYRDMPRWLFCVEAVKKTFNLVLSRLFINKYIDKEEKKGAVEMIELVQEAYKRKIKASNWLDEETKQAALTKANKIRKLVGYPDVIFDDAALDKLYEDTLPQVKSTHFENYLLGLGANTKLTVPILDKAAEEIRSWQSIISPLVVNAFYFPTKNSIWFPFAILQLPYFQHNRLALRNEDGRKFNWWTNKIRAIFAEKSQCFIDQFSEYCPEELQGDNATKICINGEQTLGENLGDHTGLEAAFLAYRMWVEKHGAEKQLPGLTEYTSEQIFFIGFANRWCENIPPDNWVKRYQHDSHSAARYRAIGSVSNSKDFREAFNCPEGKMNRGQKSCTLW